MAYTIEFRKQVLKYIAEGHTVKELYETFQIRPSTVFNWKKLIEKNGSLEPVYSKSRSRIIDKEELKRAVEEKPDAFLYELSAKFGCTEQAVFYALKKLNVTRDKKLIIERKKSKYAKGDNRM
jgi:transposase